MKNNVIYIVFGVLIAWNIWLTFYNDREIPVSTIDYELLDSIYSKKESKIAEHDTVFNQIAVTITRDSSMIHMADRPTRDSLRNLLNPR